MSIFDKSNPQQKSDAHFFYQNDSAADKFICTDSLCIRCYSCRYIKHCIKQVLKSLLLSVLFLLLLLPSDFCAFGFFCLLLRLLCPLNA